LAEHCTFCKIVAGEEPASRVYEDDRAIAFLDIRPANEGHALVVPRSHYENIHDIPEEELAHLFTVVKKIATAVKKSTEADGISVFQNNGRAAGQIVFHIHVHVIPRFDAQKIRRRRPASRRELEDVAETIRGSLS
jgi:histidine triad (HIT) family protein